MDDINLDIEADDDNGWDREEEAWDLSFFCLGLCVFLTPFAFVWLATLQVVAGSSTDRPRNSHVVSLDFLQGFLNQC